MQDVFRQYGRPLGIEEIVAAARRSARRLNEATVYRNIKQWLLSGWLREIPHPVHGMLYEEADKEHHHHFHCRECDRLFELQGCAIRESGMAPPGFVAEGHELLLFGMCAACQEPVSGDASLPHRPRGGVRSRIGRNRS